MNYASDPLTGLIVIAMGVLGTLIGTPIGAVWSAFHSGERRIRAELWWLGCVWGLSLLLTDGLVTAGVLVVEMISLQGLAVVSGAFLLFSGTTRKNLPQAARKYGPVFLGAAVLILLISMFHAYTGTALGLWEQWLIIAGVAGGICLFIGARANDGGRS